MRRLALALVASIVALAGTAGSAHGALVLSTGALAPDNDDTADVQVFLYNPTNAARPVTVRAAGASGVAAPLTRPVSVPANGEQVVSFDCTMICVMAAELVDPSGTVIPSVLYQHLLTTVDIHIQPGQFAARTDTNPMDLRYATMLGLGPITSTLGTLPAAIAQTGSRVSALDPRIASLQTAITRQTRLLTRQARTLKRLSRQVRRLSKTRP
jgi:hypothetical protein